MNFDICDLRHKCVIERWWCYRSLVFDKLLKTIIGTPRFQWTNEKNAIFGNDFRSLSEHILVFQFDVFSYILNISKLISVIELHFISHKFSFKKWKYHSLNCGQIWSIGEHRAMAHTCCPDFTSKQSINSSFKSKILLRVSPRKSIMLSVLFCRPEYNTGNRCYFK